MKNNILLKLNVCACAVLLAACGSSGGSTESVVNPSHTPTTQAAPQIQFSGTVHRSQTRDDDGPNQYLEFVTAGTSTGSSLDKIMIDGKEVTLIDNGIKSNGWYTVEKDDEEKIIHGGYSYTRFGVYMRENQHRQDTDSIYLISHGQLTDSKQMPTTGSVVYKGDALYDGKVPALNDYTEFFVPATSQFNVDYGAKTIEGYVQAPNVAHVDLKGTISGNEFSGSHNGVNMKGHFFGPTAEELSGSFHKGTKDNAEFSGVFGAKKQ